MIPRPTYKCEACTDRISLLVQLFCKAACHNLGAVSYVPAMSCLLVTISNIQFWVPPYSSPVAGMSNTINRFLIAWIFSVSEPAPSLARPAFFISSFKTSHWRYRRGPHGSCWLIASSSALVRTAHPCSISQIMILPRFRSYGFAPGIGGSP